MKEVAELDVYRLAEALSDMIWNDFDRWPEKAQRTIGYQVIRAADSIAANIAEGYGRGSRADYARFVAMSRGSAAEVESQLLLARRLAFASPLELDALLERVTNVRCLLSGLLRSL